VDLSAKQVNTPRIQFFVDLDMKTPTKVEELKVEELKVEELKSRKTNS